MNQQKRRFEIDMMWRQLGEEGALNENDYHRGMSVRLFLNTHVFTSLREVHALLSGALDAVRYQALKQEQEDADQSG